MSSPHTRLEELARKQQGVQETDSLWRRHVAQSKLQLDATNAAVQNAQHDNQLVEHATEETLAEQKVRKQAARAQFFLLWFRAMCPKSLRNCVVCTW